MDESIWKKKCHYCNQEKFIYDFIKDKKGGADRCLSCHEGKERVRTYHKHK